MIYELSVTSITPTFLEFYKTVEVHPASPEDTPDFIYANSKIPYQTMHEYLTSYGDNSRYGECIDCDKRTPHICLKCNYCYSCHFKIERIEKEHWQKPKENNYPVVRSNRK